MQATKMALHYLHLLSQQPAYTVPFASSKQQQNLGVHFFLG